MEIWKPVVGYEGYYEVSSEGRVRGLDRVLPHNTGGFKKWRGKLLKPGTDHGGYQSVVLCRGGNLKQLLVHVLVLEAFVGPRPEGEQACHGPNGNSDNSVSNLRWGTALSNHDDRRKAGTIPKGEQIHLSKLNEASVVEIRKRRIAGESATALGAEYGVDPATIRAVCRRDTWKHVL